MRFGFLVIGFCVASATPAAADWAFRWGGTSAGVWATNDDGTSLALSCDRSREGRMRVEYTVVPAEGATGAVSTAIFDVGGQTTEVAVEAYVPSGGRLQIMRSDLPYGDPEIVALRDQLRAGNSVSLVAHSDYAAASFSLRGSSRALNRMEDACQQIWDRL